MALQRGRHPYDDDVDRKGFEFIFSMIQIRLVVPAQALFELNVCQARSLLTVRATPR